MVSVRAESSELFDVSVEFKEVSEFVYVVLSGVVEVWCGELISEIFSDRRSSYVFYVLRMLMSWDVTGLNSYGGV